MRKHAVWLVWALTAIPLPAQVAVTSLKVDGRELAMPALAAQSTNREEKLRVPPGAKEVRFTVSAGELNMDQPYRLQCKLEGFDDGWRELYSHMRLVVRVLDADNVIIAATEFKAGHDSPGWRGTLRDSAFTPNHGEVVAPSRAAKVQLWCVSGGPEYTLGLFAFRNVVVHVGTPGGGSARETRYSVESGTDLDQLLGSPAEWRRDGTRPGMAQVVRLEQPQPHHALVLSDTDPRAFAAWIVPQEKCVPVQPGDRITVEWESCYAIGSGGPQPLVYKRLPPGNYWFRVVARSLDGLPVAAEVSLPLVVLSPFWARTWFWLAAGGAISLSAIWSARRFTKRRMQRALDLAERRHALERERTRIARDIHDDLGTTLTQISMVSETARSNPRNPRETLAELERICTSVREATQAMDEIVWAADPENDSPDELATYLSGFAQDLLNGVGVRCRLDMPARFPAGNLSAEVRHNLFLAFKESLNNALKHGHPSEVRILMALRDGRLTLQIEDNGQGFSPATQPGHGLVNMRNRVEKLGGRFTVESEPGLGTRVRFEVPISLAS